MYHVSSNPEESNRGLADEAVPQAAELFIPPTAHDREVYNALTSILAQLGVVGGVAKHIDGSLQHRGQTQVSESRSLVQQTRTQPYPASKHKVAMCVCLKGHAVACASSGIKLMHRVPQAARLEGNHAAASDKELLLHDSSRLKERGHHAKVAPKVHQGTVCEERSRVRPEATRVATGQVLKEREGVGESVSGCEHSLFYSRCCTPEEEEEEGASAHTLIAVAQRAP